tara:strand:+ start:2473 stop:5814 length:3342 start_codon:yes stop_codon:yes gene_type:complete
MSNRLIYNNVLYKKLLDDKIVEISRQFLGKKYWGNKKNHGVIVAYDFIPSNKELKMLEMNTNVAIYKEYIPYFDFSSFSKFCQKNRYTKVVGVINKEWYSRSWTAKTTPSTDFISLLEDYLSGVGVTFELFTAPKWPKPIPKIDTDDNTFVLRFSFDPESKIDKLASDKSLFINHINEIGLSDSLPQSGDELLDREYENQSFPDIVLKNSILDKKRGVEFHKLLPNKDKDYFKGRGIVKSVKRTFTKDILLDEFIVSDMLDGLEEYNVEVRGLGLITNDDVILLNSEPFIDAKKYILKDDGIFEQLDAHGPNFIEDTMIEMADGKTKKIQNLRSGDEVLSYDIEDLKRNKSWRKWMKTEFGGIDSLRVHRSSIKGTVNRKVKGYLLFNGKYKVTKNASICVKGDNDRPWQFKNAHEIKIGQEILMAGNQSTIIKNIEVLDDEVNSYAIEVDRYDNYFGDRIMAHNIGMGAWCFVEGTKVFMSDGTEKNIEDVELNDEVMSWSENENKMTSSRVTGLKRPIHQDMILIKFENGTENINTFDHPYYVKGKGWCSYGPQLTESKYGMSVGLLEVGDFCYYNDNGELKEIEISYIREKLDDVQTYVIEVENFNTFFANGILTHNKDSTESVSGYTVAGRSACFLPDQLINMANGTKKKIDDVILGDEIQVFNLKEKELYHPNSVVWEDTNRIYANLNEYSIGKKKTSIVNSIQQKLHDDVYELYLENGKTLKPTGNHPFFTENKGWTTIDGHNPNHAGGSGYLKVGDKVFDVNVNDWVLVIDIKSIEGEYRTINFIDTYTGTIIADDILTHNTSQVNHINKFDVTSTSGNATDVGDDVASRQYPSSGNDHDYIHTMGGFPNPKNWISYIAATLGTGNATDRGDLVSAGQLGAGLMERPDSDGDFQGPPYAYVAGNQNGGRRNVIQHIDASTTSVVNSTDRGDLVNSVSSCSGLSGSRNGFVAGGRTQSPSYAHPTNQIVYFSLETSTGDASDAADLTQSKRAGPGSGGSGYDEDTEIANFAGGYTTAPVNVIEYWDLTTVTTNSADKGDLTQAKYVGQMMSGDDNFYHCGGHNGKTSVNVIEYWDIATTAANGSDKGDMSTTMHGQGGGAGYSGLTP